MHEEWSWISDEEISSSCLIWSRVEVCLKNLYVIETNGFQQKCLQYIRDCFFFICQYTDHSNSSRDPSTVTCREEQICRWDWSSLELYILYLAAGYRTSKRCWNSSCDLYNYPSFPSGSIYSNSHATSTYSEIVIYGHLIGCIRVWNWSLSNFYVCISYRHVHHFVSHIFHITFMKIHYLQY